MRPQIEAGALTIEYDSVRGRHALLIVPFPDREPDDTGLAIVGDLAELRGVVDSLSGLLDDLDDEAEQ